MTQPTVSLDELVKSDTDESVLTAVDLVNSAVDLLKFASKTIGATTTDGKPATELFESLRVEDKDFESQPQPQPQPSVSDNSAVPPTENKIDLGSSGEGTAPIIRDAFNFARALVSRMKNNIDTRSDWAKSEASTKLTDDFLKDPKIFLQTVPEHYQYNGAFTKALSSAYTIREVIIEETSAEDEDEKKVERIEKLRDALKDSLYDVIRVVWPLSQTPLPAFFPSLKMDKPSPLECKQQ